VSAMRGVKRVWLLPETSAPRRRADPDRGGNRYEENHNPDPPSHWVMLRQKSIGGVSASMSESSVAPVVVKPLIASKVESRGLTKVRSTRKASHLAPRGAPTSA